MDVLEQIFMDAKACGLDICVELTIPGQDDSEFIINKNKSLDNKLAYYKETYDDDLVHKRCRDIRIVSIKMIKFDI